MAGEARAQPTRERPARPCSTSHEATALVLEGPISLRLCQRCVLKALRERGSKPCWAAGTSLGAYYAALIAGNAPERRIASIGAFFALAPSLVDSLTPERSGAHEDVRGRDDRSKGFWSTWLRSTLFPDRAEGRLCEALRRLVDFDRINRTETRLTLGFVDRASGHLTWLDNTKDRIGPEEVIASARTATTRVQEEPLSSVLAKAPPDLSVLPISAERDADAADPIDAAYCPGPMDDTFLALIYGRGRPTLPEGTVHGATGS